MAINSSPSCHGRTTISAPKKAEHHADPRQPHLLAQQRNGEDGDEDRVQEHDGRAGGQRRGADAGIEHAGRGHQQHRAKKLLLRVAAHREPRNARPAGHDGDDGGKEEPRPGDLHQRIALHQVLHDGIEADEAEHGRKHPEDAGRPVLPEFRRHQKSSATPELSAAASPDCLIAVLTFLTSLVVFVKFHHGGTVSKTCG